MRGELDPVTRSKIEAFAARRRRLIVVRGICAVFAVLLALMTALALLDFFVLMADGVRWTLSALAYLAAAGAAWWTCGRLLWRSPDARELARLLESARPDLREDLLSAVELGDPSAAGAWDSEEFREKLQSDVAGRVRDVEVASILPVQRIRRWILAAGAVVAAGFLLLLVPGLRFDHLLNRALRPLANLERISRVKVAILEPSPPERTVPQGDVVAVRIELSGPEAKSAVLETFPEGGKPERVEMAPAGGRRFESGIVVGRGTVAWRVRAGDAITRQYVLSSVPRPEATAFHKTYTYPDYARKAPRVEPAAPGGDLVELEGSTAEVELELNTEVRSGELRLEQAGKSTAIRLEAGSAPRRLRAKVPMTASGTYRVHLVAEATGFENKFSPQYEIRAMPDLVPRVTLEEPAQDLIVPPDEVIALRGTAKDDLGLKVVAQAVKVNQGDWKEWVLKEDAGAQAAVSRRWDLFELGVTPGDRVTTKLVATDLKGSRAESSPVTVTISAPGFDPSRHLPLAAKEAAYEALLGFRDAVRALEKRVGEAAQAPGGDELARKQSLLNAAQEAEKLAAQAESAEASIREALRVARAGREADDLALAARLVRRAREAGVLPCRADLDRAAAGGTEAAEALKRARELAGRANGQATAAEDRYRDVLASEEAMALLNDLRELARDEEAVARQLASALAAKDAKAWERLARRQGVVGNQLKTVVEEVLRIFAMRAEPGQGKRAQAIRQQLEQARGAFEKAAAAAPGPELAGPSEHLRRAVESAWHQVANLEREAGQRGEQARDALAKAAEASWEDVRRALGEMDRLVDAQKRQSELSARNAAAAELEKARKAAAEANERATGAWRAARAQLEARAGTEEARRDADAFFVSDASLGGRALQATLDGHLASSEAAPSRESLRTVDRAFRVLETGHDVAALGLALRALAEAERWHAAGPDAASRHPKDWRWMDDGMKSLPERLKDAGLPAEIGRDLGKNWRAQGGEAVRSEMRERHALGRRPAGQAAALERLGADVAQASSRLQPHLEAARKELQKLVPTLHERLQKLAEAAEKAQQKTEALSDRASQAETAQVRPEARQLLENQQSLDKQLEEVTAELRRDANVQDLFTEQGRERARDADDAVAMLRQAPPKAEDLLAQAAASQQKQAQEHALEKAAEQQGKLADALETLAKHYEAMAKGKPEETRPELRRAEEALGIKPQLDAQYAQMEKLAALAQQPAEAQKAALTEELRQNEEMKRELQELTQGALARAEQALQEAAKAEQKQVEALNQAAQQQAQMQKGVEAEARKLAEEARRMAKEDVAKVAQEAPAAKAQAQAAQKDLGEGAQAAEQATAPSLEKAAKEFNDAAQDLQQAQQAAQNAAQQAQQNRQKEANEAAQAQQKAQQEQNQAQAAQKAAEAAQKAQQAAEQAAKMAQDAAAKQPQNAEAQAQAKQAQQKAQQAAQQNQQAQQAAQQQSAEAAQAQQQAAAEQAQARQAEQAAAQAQQAAQSAAQETNDARQLAQKAQQLAQQAGQAKPPPAQNLAQQAQALAAEAQRMAQQDVQQLAQDSPAAQPSAQAAQKDLGEAAQAAQQATPQGLEQAAKELNDAAQDLQQAQQAAQSAAQQAQQAAAKEPQNAQAKQAAQKAQSAAQAAAKEAGDARQLAQQAQALAQQARAQAQTPAGQKMAQAAQAQQQVGQQLEQAQADLALAAQNQAALGEAPEALATAQVAEGVQGVRQNEVPAAQSAAQSATPAEAAQAAAKAQSAIEAQSAALAKAQGAPQGQAQAEGAAAEGSALSEPASEFLAQALNELNAQGQGPPKPGQGQAPPGQDAAQQALQSAAQAQAQAMAQQRSQGPPGQQPGQQGQQPGQSPFSQAPGAGKGAKIESGPLAEGQTLSEVLLKPGEWGKLPPKLARDLMEAQREGVSGEYRAMVETYFRVIAEKAREKK